VKYEGATEQSRAQQNSSWSHRLFNVPPESGSPHSNKNELGVAIFQRRCLVIGMIVPLLGLAVALQAMATFPQELGDSGLADRVAPGRQFRRQRAGALAGPARG
jgi:hypothetical protein